MNEKRPLSFTLFSLRLLSGLAGGIGGMLIAFVAYFLMSNFIPSGEEVSSLSFFAIIVMAFLGTITANTITATSLTFMDPQKYSRRKTIITQVFLFNLILFFLSILLYVVAISLDLTLAVAALHFLLSAFISALIMEVLAGHEYSLIGIYSNALAIFISVGLAMLLLNTNVSEQILILGAMPTVWLILMLVGGLMELVYDNFLKLYGIDALNTSTDIGGDSLDEKEPEEDEEDNDGDEEKEISGEEA